VQLALWLAVLLSVALVVLQVLSSTQGGVQDTTRQAMRPEQAISWWHWP
jgi:hypothetical protein